MLIELNGHEKDSGIYRIVNLVNGRIYIGSAMKLAQRSIEHGRTLRGNRHKNPFLQHDFNKCGNDSFKFEIVEVVSGKEELIKREQFYLDQYFDYKVNCYNICPTAGNSLGRVFSEETKAKISAKAKGRKASDETKAAISAGGKGRKHTAEQVAKHIARITGIKFSPERLANMSKANIGKKATEETKAKMSAVHKIRWAEYHRKQEEELKNEPSN